MSDSLSRLVEAVRSAGVDIAPGYCEYVRLAFAIANDCGEAGREGFIALCSLSVKFNREKAERLFSNSFKKGAHSTETRPSFKRGTTHKVALLQISTQDTCFLFRLNRICMPDSLQEFLMSDTLKIGLSLKDDFNSLRKREDVHPDRGNWIELQDYVGRFGIADRSLQKIFANLFGQKISKSQRLSNWEAEVLSEGQKLYAATDAWACVEIYNCLTELERTGGYEITEEEPIETTVNTNGL